MTYIVVTPRTKKASNYIIQTTDRNGKEWYIVLDELRYYSRRYYKWVVCKKYFVSDGATGAYDINSFGWLFHDKMCNTGAFNDGTRCTNWQASCVLSDVLVDERRWVRSFTWKYATFIGGGGKARKNGMFNLTA